MKISEAIFPPFFSPIFTGLFISFQPLGLNYLFDRHFPPLEFFNFLREL
jgi:hypothetical protein